MKNLFVYLRAVGLGTLNGFVFGVLCEIANRIYFGFQLRELERTAAEGGGFVDSIYPWHWWTLPCFFLLIFAIASLCVEWFQSNRYLSDGVGKRSVLCLF